MPSRSLVTRRPSLPIFGRRFPLWSFLGSLLAVAFLVWALWPATVLEFHLGEDGPLVKVMPVTPGERITYSYVHSIQKRPVDEILEVAPNDHLVVRETDYDMVGVGLPSDVLGGDYVFDSVNDKFRIVNMSRDIPILRVRVASTKPNTMQVEGEKFRLDSLAKPLSLLVIDVARRPRFATLGAIACSLGWTDLPGS